MRIPRLTIVGHEEAALPPPSGLEPHVWRDVRGAVAVHGRVSARECWMSRPGVGVFHFDAERGDGVRAAVSPSVSDETVRDAFERNVLPRVVWALGGEALHASAVVVDGSVVAFCGRSGTGKSTLAFGLHGRGYPLWADDAVAFEASPNGIKALALPFRLRLDQPAAEAEGVEPGKTAPLGAVFMLERVPGSNVEVARLSSGEAFSALLFHAHFLTLSDPDRHSAMTRHYLELSADVPIFAARFPPGLGELPRLLDRVEERLAGLAVAPEPVPIAAEAG